MEFQTRQDYAVAEKIYSDHALLNAAQSDVWSVKFANEFHMTNDRHLFNINHQGVPLYEGKMIHQYDAFYAEPQFWINEQQIDLLSHNLQNQLDTYRVVHRRIASSTNERTLISAIVPPHSACEVNATVILVGDGTDQKNKLYLVAILNSFSLDYIIRYKVTTTLNMFYLQTLPVPRLTAGNPYFDAIVPRAAQLTCTRPEFADLWQQVMAEPWDASKGATDPALRAKLRAELDGLVAHLYGLTESDFAHVLSTFPLVADTVKAAALAAYRESIIA
jgi:hypothetical protein